MKRLVDLKKDYVSQVKDKEREEVAREQTKFFEFVSYFALLIEFERSAHYRLERAQRVALELLQETRQQGNPSGKGF